MRAEVSRVTVGSMDGVFAEMMKAKAPAQDSPAPKLRWSLGGSDAGTPAARRAAAAGTPCTPATPSLANAALRRSALKKRRESMTPEDTQKLLRREDKVRRRRRGRGRSRTRARRR